MRGMRRRAAFALLLLSLCVPAMHVSAEAGGGQAEYTVEYIARDQGTETLLARDTYRAPAGRRVNVPHRDFDHCKKEPGQDIRDQMGEVEEPVRQGYIFQGWDQELPEVMPEGETVLKALWEPGESQYTVLRWMENAEDEGYTLLGETEVRTGRTGSRVTASRDDVERAGEMADWFPDSEYYGDYYGFDYARCDDTVVTADGKCVFRGVSSHIYIYMKRDTFRLDYVDVSDQGESRVLYTEEVTYRDEVTLAYIPENEAEHKNQKFTGWYLSPALTSAGEPLQGFLMPSDHVRVYAGWTPADRTVKFDVQADQEEVSKVPAEQSVRAGNVSGSRRLPSVPDTFSWDGSKNLPVGRIQGLRGTLESQWRRI